MLCDNCKQKEASIHYTQVINDSKIELNLCDDCAKKKGMPMKTTLSVNDIFQGLLDMTLGLSPNYLDSGSMKTETARCDNCGMSFEEFRETGMFGCNICYSTFNTQLNKIIKSMQANVKHTGKLPIKMGSALIKERTIENFKTELETAINEERYEDAAKLRDQIRELRKEN